MTHIDPHMIGWKLATNLLADGDLDVHDLPKDHDFEYCIDPASNEGLFVIEGLGRCPTRGEWVAASEGYRDRLLDAAYVHDLLPCL